MTLLTEERRFGSSVRGETCQLWHRATSNCPLEALRVNSPDSFLDKSVSSGRHSKCVMEGGGPTQVRRWRWAGEQVMKELLMDSVIGIEGVEIRAALSWYSVSGKMSSWARAGSAKIWPFPLTWICFDLSLGPWQLMDDWWCCFSSVAVTSGGGSSDPKWPRFLLHFVSVFFNLLNLLLLFGFYREKHANNMCLLG